MLNKHVLPTKPCPAPSPIVDQLYNAARHLHPAFHVYVTHEPPISENPAWEYRAGRKWLVLRSTQGRDAVAGVSTALVAQSGNYMGKGVVTGKTELPEDLMTKRSEWVLRLRDEMREGGDV